MEKIKFPSYVREAVESQLGKQEGTIFSNKVLGVRQPRIGIRVPYQAQYGAIDSGIKQNKRNEKIIQREKIFIAAFNP